MKKSRASSLPRFRPEHEVRRVDLCRSLEFMHSNHDSHSRSVLHNRLDRCQEPHSEEGNSRISTTEIRRQPKARNALQKLEAF